MNADERRCVGARHASPVIAVKVKKHPPWGGVGWISSFFRLKSGGFLQPAALFLFDFS